MRSVDNRSITIVRIIDRLNVGGPAIHAVLTTRGLDVNRFRTILVHGTVEPNEADMSYLLDDTNIERVEIPSLGRELRPVRDIRTAWKLFKLLRHLRPDIVHTHKAKAGAIGRVVALLAGVPVRVHTFHGHVFNGYFSPLKTAVFVNIERVLARLSTRLIALSSGLADELSQGWKIGPSSAFTIVPLGFDLEPFRQVERYRGELRSEIGVSSDVRLVGIVGRMVPVKDHRTFIDAAAHLATRRSDVHFVFVGGGELERDIRARIRYLGLDDRTHFLGWRRDLFRIYSDLDVVALSSVNEGTPVALIEAMSAGVPVVATAVGGVSDLLQNGRLGELVPPGHAMALADGIARCLSADAHQRASLHRSAILASFGADRLCSDLSALYTSLLSQG